LVVFSRLPWCGHSVQPVDSLDGRRKRGTGAGGRPAGRIDARCLADPRQRRSRRPVGLARVASARPGAGDTGCRARRRSEGLVRGGGTQPAASPDSQRGRCGPNLPRRRVRTGRPDWCEEHPGASEQHTSSKPGRTWRHGRGRESAPVAPAHPSPSRLRACWVTQPPSGLAVTPASWTRRVASSTGARICSRRSQTVPTVKQSPARSPAAGSPRNVRQVLLARRVGDPGYGGLRGSTEAAHYRAALPCEPAAHRHRMTLPNPHLAAQGSPSIKPPHGRTTRRRVECGGRCRRG